MYTTSVTTSNGSRLVIAPQGAPWVRVESTRDDAGVRDVERDDRDLVLGHESDDARVSTRRRRRRAGGGAERALEPGREEDRGGEIGWGGGGVGRAGGGRDRGDVERGAVFERELRGVERERNDGDRESERGAGAVRARDERARAERGRTAVVARCGGDGFGGVE